MKLFTLYWKDGTRQVVEGLTAAGAMTENGYGRGALRALDFWAEGDDQGYAWNAEARKWDKVVQ